MAEVFFFRKASSLAQYMSTIIAAGKDSKDTLLIIATCSSHLKKLKDGENAIIALRAFPDVSVEDTIRSLDATHLLAEIYLSSGRLGDARIECQKALKKKRKATGKDSNLIIGLWACDH